MGDARVLIAVRHRVFGEALQSVLELDGFDVAGRVSSAQDAVARAESLLPAIILLDSQLVLGPGEALIRRLLAASPRAKIVVPADGEEDGASIATIYGVAGVIYKDAPAQSLLSLIRDMVGEEQAVRKPKAIHTSWFTKEVSALGAILCFSVFLARDLFAGENLITGYADWIVHAYRIRSLQEYGFLTWTHDWSGGFPLWQSYQFLPHVSTLALQSLTGWSVTKAMVFATGVLFVLLRLIVYGGLRLSGLPASAALVGAMLTLPIVGYYGRPSGPLSEFSLLWGITLFPIVIFLLAGQGNVTWRIYLSALVIGLGVYLHPILSIIGTLVLLCRFVAFKDIPLKALLYALAIAGLAASFYWLPTVLGDKPSYTTATTLSYALKRSDFQTQWLGLGPSLITVALGVLILRAKSFRMDRANPRLFTTTAATLGALLLILAAAYLGLTPRLFELAMPQRWIAFIGTLLAILGAFIAASAGRKWHSHLVLAAALAAVGADSLTIARGAMPSVSFGQPETQVVASIAGDGQVTYSDRLVSTSGLVPEISYSYFGKVRLVGNYFAQGAVDILYPPLMWLLLSEREGSAIHNRDFTLALAYMRAAGGTLFVVPESEPIARALLPGGRLAGAMRLRHRSNGYALFEPPSKAPEAIIISAATAQSLLFPDIRYDNDEQNRFRDGLVLRLAGALEAPETIAAEVSYPRQNAIAISAANVSKDSYLIALAPYDSGWEASVNGKIRKVERTGPHYIGLDLSDLEGSVEIDLAHQMPWTWKAGIALVAMALVVTAFLSLSTWIRPPAAQPSERFDRPRPGPDRSSP